MLPRNQNILVATLAVSFGIATNPAAARILATPQQLLAAKRVDFVGRNAMSIEHSQFGDMLRSTPQHSASGLYEKLAVDGRELSHVRWIWKVDRLQSTADLRRLAVEDSGATIFFIFGEPSFFNRDVPTLAYVWSSTNVPAGTMINSQRYDSLRYIQMHGPESVGTFKEDIRDVAADFRVAFRREPEELQYIAVFNDNDQTGEPCSALFGTIEAQ